MNCLDEGLLQALIDGELSADARRGAEAHVASCPACAEELAGAAREFALFSQALAVEGSLVVPTERLRANITSAVAEMRPAAAADRAAVRESSSGRAGSFWSSLASSLAPRPVAVFASVALVAVVLAAAFFALRPGTGTGEGEREVAKESGPSPRPSTDAAAAQTTPPPAAVEANKQGGAASDDEVAKFRPKNPGPELAKNRPKPGPPQLDKTVPKPPRPDDSSAGQLAAATPGPKTPRADLLPGEREYVREIAALKSSIERQKMQTLSPTLRAEYERNVAVVDEAIASTRAAVRSNPADTDAREFLRAAYQEKLDLLSAVAGKSQLAAADR